MKKKVFIIIFVSLGIIALISGIIFKSQIDIFMKNNIEIIDATFSCGNSPEKFYEDSKYIYYFTCHKSDSIYVKYSNGNKELVTKALDEGHVTMSQLEKAGLKFLKDEKNKVI